MCTCDFYSLILLIDINKTKNRTDAKPSILFAHSTPEALKAANLASTSQILPEANKPFFFFFFSHTDKMLQLMSGG